MMAAEYVERRLHPRIEIDGEMNYITCQSDEICAGLLENLSEGGARIWIGQELPLASQVVFRMESRSGDEADMTFRATLLYTLPRQRVAQYGYGCKIEVAADWPDNLAETPDTPGVTALARHRST